MEGFECMSSTTNVNNSVLLAVSGVREGAVSLRCSTNTVLGAGVSLKKRKELSKGRVLVSQTAASESKLMKE